MTTHDRGHRLRPHTADLVVEAWGPTREACIAEAVLGLVDAFAVVPGNPVSTPVPIAFDRADDPELLVAVLEEVVYTCDVLGVVPVDVLLVPTEDGGLAGTFDVVPVEATETVGSVPKAVARSELHLGPDGHGRWHCRVTIDV